MKSLKRRKRALIELKSALLENLHNFSGGGRWVRNGSEENEDLDKGKTFHSELLPLLTIRIVQSKEQQKANKIN